MILAAGITAPRAQAYRFRLRAGEFTWEITRRYSEFADLERAHSHLATERYRPCISVLGDWRAFFGCALQKGWSRGSASLSAISRGCLRRFHLQQLANGSGKPPCKYGACRSSIRTTPAWSRVGINRKVLPIAACMRLARCLSSTTEWTLTS